jgi:hypothetical protein
MEPAIIAATAPHLIDAAPIPGRQPGRSLTMSGSNYGVAPNRWTWTLSNGSLGPTTRARRASGHSFGQRAGRARAGGGNDYKLRSANERSAADTILVQMHVRTNLRPMKPRRFSPLGDTGNAISK